MTFWSYRQQLVDHLTIQFKQLSPAVVGIRWQQRRTVLDHSIQVKVLVQSQLSPRARQARAQQAAQLIANQGTDWLLLIGRTVEHSYQTVRPINWVLTENGLRATRVGKA